MYILVFLISLICVNAVTDSDVQLGLNRWYNTVNTTGNISGNIAIDKVGISNATFNSGMSCNATSCALGTGTLNLNNAFTASNQTVIVWIRTSTTSTEKTLVSNTAGSAFMIEWNWDAQYRFGCYDGSASSGAKSQSAITDNALQMLTVTYDSGIVHFYQNNANIDNVAGTNTLAITTNVINRNAVGGQLFLIAFWNRSLSSAEIGYIYGKGQYYDPFVVTPVNASSPITFISQTPSNVTLTSIFDGSNVNITYNFSNVNLSNPLLNVTVYHSETNCYIYINGSCLRNNNTFQAYAQISNVTVSNYSIISFTLEENDIIPRTGNLNQTHFTTHLNQTLNNANSFISTEILNVSNSEIYNVLEVAGYSSLNNSKIYACNNSYDFASNVLNNTACLEIGTLKSVANHSDDQLIPFTIVNGKINNVLTVTQTMYFMQRGFNTGSNIAFYVNNFTRTNAIRTSSSSGTSWTAQTFTTMLHLHQLNNSEYFDYKASGLYNGSYNDSGLHGPDLIDVPTLAPTQPIIINPFDSIVNSRYLNISWLASLPFAPGINISYYNITLLNANLSVNQTIQGNNSLTLYYVWDVFNANLSLGTYAVRVTAFDNQGFSSSDFEFFNLTRNALLNITVKEYFSNSTVNNYTIFLTDYSTGLNESYNSTNGLSSFGIIKNNNYSLFIDAPGYAYKQQNYSASNLSIQYLNISIYLTNSLNIFIYDELLLTLINQNVSLIGTSPSYNFNASTTNGTLFLSNLTEGLYSLYFTSSNYSNRTFFVTMTNRTTQTLNIYLLANAYPIGVYIKNAGEEPIYNASILIQKVQTNGSTITIAQGITDGVGYFNFQLGNGVTYLWTINAETYNLKRFELTPYFANQPYVIKLSSTTNTLFTPFNEFIQYAYNPTSTLLTKTMQTFTFATVGINSSFGSNSILWTSLACNGSGVNVSGSPSGSTITQNYNLSNFSGTFTCNYGFEVDTYAPFNITVNYFVQSAEPINTSLTEATNKIVNDTPNGWLGLIGMGIIVFFVLILSGFLLESRDPNTVLVFVCVAILFILGLLNVFPTLFSIVVCVEIVLMFFISRGGY